MSSVVHSLLMHHSRLKPPPVVDVHDGTLDQLIGTLQAHSLLAVAKVKASEGVVSEHDELVVVVFSSDVNLCAQLVV